MLAHSNNCLCPPATKGEQEAIAAALNERMPKVDPLSRPFLVAIS